MKNKFFVLVLLTYCFLLAGCRPSHSSVLTKPINAPTAKWTYAQSFREQDGYAIVLGEKIYYWLYDTYTYNNGNGDVIYDQIVPHWIEEMGYVIDYDNIEEYNPNTELAFSVKALMTQRNCDISLTLVTKDLGFAPYDYVIINDYDKSEEIYRSTVYPLYK